MDIVWNVQTSDEICDLYTQCLLNSSDRKVAWEHWRGTNEGSKTCDWHPGMTLNDRSQECNLYETYFPIIVNKAIGCRKILTYRVDKTIPPLHMWLNLPHLDFLPSHANDVIAGAGGLLCINGGEQSIVSYSRAHQSSNDSKCEQQYCKAALKHLSEESTLLVCNPLTKEIKYLPKQTTYCFNSGLVARMIFSYPCTLPPLEHDHISKRHRSEYKLIVVGNHETIDGKKRYTCNKIVLLTYDSKSDEWVLGTAIHNARLVSYVKSDIAVVGECIFMGGKIIREYQRQHIDEPKSRIWENKLFKVNIYEGKWNIIDFCITDCNGNLIEMQAPIIVQCRTEGEVYAITRKKCKPRTISIYQVMLLHDNPTGVMKIVTCMPEDVFVALFEETISSKAYECSAGLHFIAFLAAFSSQSVVAVFNLHTCSWSISKRPIVRGCLAQFSLARCEWTPNFVSKP